MEERRLYNRLEDNYHLANKKALFYNLKMFYEAQGQDPWRVLPLTFHVKNGLADASFSEFEQHFRS
jgi:hypothetical protein